MTDASVSVNGKPAGKTHQGGFTQFCYDVTQLLDYGKKNRLEVMVEKQSRDRSVNNAERRADWWLFGGIYRPVYLRALPKAHIAHAGIDARADGTVNITLATEGHNRGLQPASVAASGGRLATLPPQWRERERGFAHTSHRGGRATGGFPTAQPALRRREALGPGAPQPL